MILFRDMEDDDGCLHLLGSNEHSETVEVVIMDFRQNHMTNRATL